MLGKEVPTTTTIKEGWGKGAFELRPDPCEQPQPKAWASSFFLGGGASSLLPFFPCYLTLYQFLFSGTLIPKNQNYRAPASSVNFSSLAQECCFCHEALKERSRNPTRTSSEWNTEVSQTTEGWPGEARGVLFDTQLSLPKQRGPNHHIKGLYSGHPRDSQAWAGWSQEGQPGGYWQL